jgi:iron complex outermembrane receptor protein
MKIAENITHLIGVGLEAKIQFILATILFLIPLSSFSQGIELEPITIKKIYIRDSFSSEDIKHLPYFSLEEIIDYSSNIDLRKRSSFGIQQDVSLRGSIFEDTTISLDGIKINDPQTGHFNLEIPLTSADLEEAEIFKNSQKINFVTKRPEDKGFFLRNSFGQHALWEELFSLNFPLKEIKNRLSVEHKISKGDRHDTDFEIYNFSYNLLWQGQDKELEFLFGNTKRDFGADSFYLAAYPFEEEHIRQRFFLLRAALEEKLFKVNNSLYLRRHRDKYILDRHRPSFYTNYHTTYIYGFNSELDFYNDLFLAFVLERETIDSTNLKKHYRLKKGTSFGIKDKEIGKFIYSCSFGIDYYENWEYLENIHLGLGYLLKDNLKLKFSFDRIWRVPSFTELYYSDPANKGNAELGVQKSNNFELGLDFSPVSNISLAPSLFIRSQSNTIDWVKNNSSDVWQAQNVKDIDAYGADLAGQVQFKDCILDKISLGYTYLNLNKNSPYSFSKYVFDYNQHKIVSNLGFNFKGVYANFISNFSNPVDRQKYVTFDLKVEKKISNFIFTLEGINIFNKSYEEMKDIDGTERWYKISVAYVF